MTQQVARQGHAAAGYRFVAHAARSAAPTLNIAMTEILLGTKYDGALFTRLVVEVNSVPPRKEFLTRRAGAMGSRRFLGI